MDFGSDTTQKAQLEEVTHGRCTGILTSGNNHLKQGHGLLNHVR